jgi:hypothetical protein
MPRHRKKQPPIRAASSKRGLDTLQLPVGTILGTQDRGYKDGLSAQVDGGGLLADNILSITIIQHSRMPISQISPLKRALLYRK